MRNIRQVSSVVLGAAVVLARAVPDGRAAAPGERLTVSGEVVDSWCTISQVMGYALGTAHYQCAVWCAVGGIPVSIRTDDARYYVVLKLGEGARNVADPAVVEFQAHRVTVTGDAYQRDGVNYLLIDEVRSDGGIVDLSHESYGIVPFGE
jgi:hypothetical protein